jgi:RND superfamily putative drug exporter
MIAPGALLESATFGVIVAVLLAVTAALFAIPAGLAVLGTNVDRWQLWSARRENPWVRLSERLSRKPGVAAALALFPLLLLSTPALALDTGPPNVANLPPDNASRKSYEAFERDRGAGWATPFEITFHTTGPITTEERLRDLKRFQLEVAREPGVQAVLGPASLLDRTAVLRRLTRQVASGGRQLTQLERGLRRLLVGTGRLHQGLQQGSQGAHALSNGLAQAATGSGQIARGTRAAAPRTKQLAAGVGQTGKGAHRISQASKRAKRGSTRLLDAMRTLTESLVNQNRDSEKKLSTPVQDAQSSVQSALRSLGSASPAAAADPAVARAKQNIQTALTQLAPLSANIADYATEFDVNAVAARRILRGMESLTAGLTQIAGGSGRLDAGIARTAAGASQVADGVGRLSAGTQSLDSGINQLLSGNGGGARALASGLDRTVSGSNRIGRGIARLLDSVVAVRQANARDTRALQRQGTNLQRASTSGYFVLAGVEGAQPATQTNVGFAINTPRGGNTARVIAIPNGGAFDEKTQALRPALEQAANATAKKMDAESVVGGPAVLLDDFDQATSARFPYLVGVLVIVTFLVLLVLFRAPVLALCAVLLNLVTVGAAVGVLILGFQTDPPPLGGPGYLDAIALSGIFAIIFGLSIDYEVFLISRLVEGHALTGTTEGAIRYSLEKTATIITGAAAVMAFVFLAFAVSPVANTRQFGIGLTVAVVLDATVVRLILLPALIRLFGDRTFAVPAWLDRVLPRFSTH